MRKLDERFVEEEVEKFRVLLRQCTNEERLEIIDALMDEYCKHCGRADPGCQCWNDE